MQKRWYLVILIVLSVSIFLFFTLRRDSSKEFAQQLLKQAGIEINGNQPWDIQVHNEKLYSRVLSEGTLGLGQAYMDGWWDCKALDQFFDKVLEAKLDTKLSMNLNVLLNMIQAQLINLQTKDRAKVVGEKHYDLGNDLYKRMLDKYMIYSCGYWNNGARNIDEAQQHKLDLICKKLQLKPGMKLLDIGCGWGGLAKFAAEKYGVQVTGLTISKEQAAFAQEFCKGLPVTIVLRDYRDVHDVFDRIVSVGMFEHVGYKNYEEFMRIVHRCLKDDGLCLLHTIGGNSTLVSGDPWIIKYIFPNSMLPSIVQIAQAIEGLFIMEDWHNFGANYDKTLMAWYDRFIKSWDAIKDQYDDRFYRMWTYYLLSCAAGFRARNIQLWQLVLSKDGVQGGYLSIR